MARQIDTQGNVPGFPRLLGGKLCLDFVNSIDERTGPHPVDHLVDFGSLARWGEHVGLLTREDVEAIRRKGAARPAVAAAVFTDAIALRETLYRIGTTVAHGEQASRPDLDRLQAAYVAALGRARLRPLDEGYQWIPPRDDLSLDAVLFPVVRSAVDLLCHDDLSRLRVCPGWEGDCGWLFYDTSRAGRRRWCSMEGCGSRVKMRRLYARQHQSCA